LDGGKEIHLIQIVGENLPSILHNVMAKGATLFNKTHMIDWMPVSIVTIAV